MAGHNSRRSSFMKTINSPYRRFQFFPEPFSLSVSACAKRCGIRMEMVSCSRSTRNGAKRRHSFSRVTSIQRVAPSIVGGLPLTFRWLRYCGWDTDYHHELIWYSPLRPVSEATHFTTRRSGQISRSRNQRCPGHRFCAHAPRTSSSSRSTPSERITSARLVTAAKRPPISIASHRAEFAFTVPTPLQITPSSLTCPRLQACIQPRMASDREQASAKRWESRRFPQTA